MTELQHLMLSVCFGAVMGSFIANIVLIIQYWMGYTKLDRKNKLI